MRVNHRILAVAALASALMAPAAGARIKCWVNDEGVRECGDTVPPEYASKSHQELSGQGVKIKETARAKTPEELRREAEKRKRAERERAAREERAKHDRVLLATFSSEESMMRMRDDQFAAIDTRIKNLERGVAKLERKRELLRAEAAKQELSGKSVSPEIKTSITRVERRIEEQRQAIEGYRRERGDLAGRYELDLARYRELKAGKPVGAP